MSKLKVYTELLGKTLTYCDAVKNERVVYFRFSDGESWEMYHPQDCCEDVYLEDIIGDVSDLLNSPLVVAECVEGEIPETPQEDHDEWTFYKFATINGSVTLRWFGTSNGYYATDVKMERTCPKN